MKNKNIILFVVFILFFLLLRLINLSLLPIFNDESIYLDWGWRSTHVPGLLFYSLYDAKQPLLLWIFGIVGYLTNDPIWSGRLVSVLTGLLTLIGIYLISVKYFSKTIALLAGLIYICIPIFVFYDRQILMESALCAVNIYSLYFLLQTLETNKTKYIIFLGVVLGIGFFIKSTSLVFLFLTTIILFTSNKKLLKNKIVYKKISIMYVSFLSVILLLLIQPKFWETLHTNSRYVLSISEIFTQSLYYWIDKLYKQMVIGIYLISPLVLFSLIWGSILLLKNKYKYYYIILFWFYSGLIIEFIFIRSANPRYLVSFLPLLCIICAYGIFSIKNNFLRYITAILILIIPLILSLQLVTNPISYLKFYSGGLFPEYLYGQTSGFGINEVVQDLTTIAERDPIIVGMAINAGNPESALQSLLQNKKNITITYFDISQFKDSVNGIECIIFPNSVYFISRDEQQAGLNKFLFLQKTYKHPYSEYKLGLYKFKTDCEGEKSLHVQMVK